MHAKQGLRRREAWVYQCFNKRKVSSIRHRLGSNQENQSLLSSAIFVRLLDRMLSAPQSWISLR
jgi:hypothetical protein